MKRTSEQEDFIYHVKNGNKNINLEARAGSGKTAVIVECGKDCSNKVFQVNVFNKKNELEMNQRFSENMNGQTWHGFGLKCIKSVNRNVEVDGDKMKKLLERRLGNEYKIDYKNDTKEIIEVKRQKINKILDLVGLAKNSFISPSPADMFHLMGHHGITLFTAEAEQQIVNDAIYLINESDEMEHVVDYDDMIRFPVLWERVFSSFDIFMGDEAQDNNKMRTMMAHLLWKKGIPCHFVGDTYQAINGFTGADSDSMNFIAHLFDSVSMPLTVNFRCGKNIIREAQRYVKDIRAYEGNCDGSVHRILEPEFINRFMPGDCALSRTNAAMVPFCFKLIKEGKNASIQGKDFGNKIISIVEGFSKKDIDDLYIKLNTWYDRQLTKLDQNSTALDASTDIYDVVKFFADQSSNLEDLKRKIKSIFTDNNTPYKFSTAHKAKGLEWEKVFILNNDQFKMTFNKKPWQVQQENNLHYVAITRAKEELTFVASKEKKGKQEECIVEESDVNPVEKKKNVFQPMHQTEMKIIDEVPRERDAIDDFLDF